MSLQLERMTETMWVTADTRLIHVVDMTDSHLTNTLRFLRRNAAALKLATLIPMGRYQETAPDGACDAIDAEIDHIIEMADDAFLMWKIPPYKAMVREAVRRKL